MTRIAIVGSREYTDMARVRQFVRSLPPDTVVLAGGCRGVDKVAEAEALRCKLTVEVLPADWGRHGRSAGPIRNRQLAEQCDEMAAFWDGTSRGTKDAMLAATALCKRVRVFGPCGEAATP